jgi:membrane fusion protein (multidrug efflux system)
MKAFEPMKDDTRKQDPDREHPLTQNPAGGAPEDDLEDEPVDDVPLYRRKRVLIPLLAILTLAVVAVWYWYVNLRGYDSTDDAYIDGNRVSISSKILGRIDSLGVDEGDSVTSGQVLVRLNDADLQAQAKQARAALNDARQAVVLAQVNLERAETDFQRAETQFQSKVIPREQYDHARSALAVAQSQLTIAQTHVATAQAQLGVVETQLGNTVISSPMSGVVAKRWVLAGDVVQPGQPIFTINDLKNVWVTANFEETKLRSLRIGDSVQVSVDAYPDRTLRGIVDQLGSSTAGQFSLIPPNNASGNFTKVTQRVPVKIILNRHDMAAADPAHPLLPGMSVEVRVKVR